MIIDFCVKKNELENKKAVILNCLINYYKNLKEKGLNMPIENDTQAKEVLSSVGIKVVG